MRCAQHSLNALLQEPAFDQQALTELALSIGGKLELAHRWPIVGNYDINVMLLALQQRGLETRWWDRRASVEELRTAAEDPACLGLIINEPRTWLFGVLRGRHWLALRKVGRAWYDLDSRRTEPAEIEADALYARLQRLLAESDGQLLLVQRASPTDEPASASGG